MTRWFPKRLRWLTVISMILLGSLVETHAGRAYCRSEFRRYFEGLSAAGVNPVQRLIFSLLLTETNPKSEGAHMSHPAPKQL